MHNEDIPDDLYHNVPLIRAACDKGATTTQIIRLLVHERNTIFARLVLLEQLRPKKYRLPDGRVVTWHCPDELIPEEKL